jgi:hypothetical protein
MDLRSLGLDRLAVAEDEGEAWPLEEGVGRLIALHLCAQVEATKPESSAVGGADRQQQHREEAILGEVVAARTVRVRQPEANGSQVESEAQVQLFHMSIPINARPLACDLELLAVAALGGDVV